MTRTKSKGGRPRRERVNATVHLGFRATAAEAKPVILDAEANKESVSAWLRDAAKQKLARGAR